MAATIDFCGELTPVAEGSTVTVGREGDVAIDDNPYLHRRLLEVEHRDGLVWLTNVGSAIAVTVADEDGLVQSWLSPGARVPVVFPRAVVWFTAGPTTYELDILIEDAPFSGATQAPQSSGSTTLGRVTFTPDQKLLVLVLAEEMLRRGNRGAGSIPPSAKAAESLDWTITKFNRKLDNVCEKLTKLGVRGLVGTNHSASNRRARLVEYALAARLIVPEDVTILDAAQRSATSARQARAAAAQGVSGGANRG